MVVFDTNVFISAAASPTGSSRACFYLWARRRFKLAVSQEVLNEYQSTAERFVFKRGNQSLDWRPLFQWISDKADCVEPAPLGKQRSRDADDDIFLACALAAGAKIVVSYDNDLLDMEKPFGIEILTPADFIARHNF